MLYISEYSIHPLLPKLRNLPEFLTLQQFADVLTDLLKSLHRRPTSSDSNHIRSVSHIYRTFLNHPDDKISLRTLRHMIYQHGCIKHELQKEGKEVLLDHKARIRIILAKRLSQFRLGHEVRDTILSNDSIGDLENLVIQTDSTIRQLLGSNISSSGEMRRLSRARDREKEAEKLYLSQQPLEAPELDTIHEEQINDAPPLSPPSSPPQKARILFPRSSQRVIRTRLGRTGATLEWTENTPVITSRSEIKRTTETLLSILHNIPPGSSLSTSISEQIASYVAEASRK